MYIIEWVGDSKIIFEVKLKDKTLNRNKNQIKLKLLMVIRLQKWLKEDKECQAVKNMEQSVKSNNHIYRWF